MAHWLSLAAAIVGLICLFVVSVFAMAACVKDPRRGPMLGVSFFANWVGWFITLWTLDTALNNGGIFRVLEGQQWGVPIWLALILATLSTAFGLRQI